jgi:hypothetical protein
MQNWFVGYKSTAEMALSVIRTISLPFAQVRKKPAGGGKSLNPVLDNRPTGPARNRHFTEHESHTSPTMQQQPCSRPGQAYLECDGQYEKDQLHAAAKASTRCQHPDFPIR